jgi:hypothetical protein
VRTWNLTYFKLVYRRNVVVVTLTTGIKFLLFTCIHLWMLEILWGWSACADRLWSGPRLQKYFCRCVGQKCVSTFFLSNPCTYGFWTRNLVCERSK